ncbi:MAG: CotH kinase family protein [Verrucomicrobia bacterium]|nr:CotH kinase family protein [Verrucomicrobiota bacterium]
MQQKTELVKQFDQDGDGRLNASERKAAREFLQKENAGGRGRRGPGGPRGFGGRGGERKPAQPGEKLSPTEVKSFPDAPLYDAQTLRTFFLEFEDADWEKELAEFKNTDVEVPAKLTVDGKIYPDVGVHFRGMSSFMMVGEGQKRSLNVSLDFVHKDQKLGGYRTLNLLNSHEDPTFLRSVLSYQIDREYLPAPKANFARVVINGESWGVYVNVQQFNKDFVKDWFGTTKGARWKVTGSPNGRGSLAYLGEDAVPYKRIYSIKSKDNEKSWADLIKLCKTLDETSADKLEAALAPMLDIDGALKFLALDNALINNDGYWIRTSDYGIYEDEKGRFHILPQDSNETFSKPGGPGFGGGPGGGRGPGGPGGPEGRGGPGGGRGFGGGPQINGVELDPLIAANDASKPLISKLLAVPSLRARYLGYVRDIADNWLDWKKLGPLAQQYQAVIASDIAKDTRKLDSTEAFTKGLTEDVEAEGPGGMTIGLKNFADQRRKYLLNYVSANKPLAEVR